MSGYREDEDGPPDPTVLRRLRLRPATGHPLEPELVLGHLREQRVLATVGPGAPDGSLDVVLATEGATHAYVVRDRALAVGPAVSDVVAGLRESLNATVEVSGTLSLWGRGDDEAHGSDAHAAASVVVSRTPVEYLPSLARAARARVQAVQVDGWTVARLDEGAEPQPYLWSARELPALHLHHSGGSRAVRVSARRRWTGEVRPGRGHRPTFGAHEVGGLARDMHERLHLPERVAVLEALALPSSLQLPGASAAALREAVASPDDAEWFGRVLSALGLPVVAADVAEGRAEMAGARSLEPVGLGGTLLASWDLFVDDAFRRGHRPRGLQWWYSAIVRHPSLLMASVTLDVLCGVGGLVWAAHNPGGVLPLVVGAVCVLLFVDAAADLAVVVRARRRRAREPVPGRSRAGFQRHQADSVT